MSDHSQPVFSTCPLCGAEGEDFKVKSDEKLYGYNHLTLQMTDTGQLATGEWGTTSVDYEVSITIDYVADCCNQSLPEAYQDELDRILGIERESE
jgi:hypothetical protein